LGGRGPSQRAAAGAQEVRQGETGAAARRHGTARRERHRPDNVPARARRAEPAWRRGHSGHAGDPHARFPRDAGQDRAPRRAPDRRTALANWLAAPDNPLTARVFVNRMWQHHFARGIVPSASDFGVRGEAPTHPELLDWLATEFIRSGWDVKHMHRLMLTSAA